jgi:hypothetical protein
MGKIKQIIKTRLDNGQELEKTIYYFLIIYKRKEIAEKEITFKQNNGGQESTIKSTFSRIRLSFEEGKNIVETRENKENEYDTRSEAFSTLSIKELGNGQISKEVYINETNKQGGWQKLELSFNQIDIEIEPQSTPGETDNIGIKWLVAKGEIAKIELSRNDPIDDRWSKNVSGIADGFEATMIAKSIEIEDDEGHFAMKHGGGNHSGGDEHRWRWYDTGLRDNGDIQLQYEEPHHENHSFTLPESKQFKTNIGKGLEGNFIGLKWCLQNQKKGGSISDGGIRCRMWVDTDPLDENNKPKNNWDIVYDFIDGENDGDEKIIQKRDYKMPDTMDMEVRRSDTKKHEVYSEGEIVKIDQDSPEDEIIGLYVRKL